jgi:hypothetical protein
MYRFMGILDDFVKIPPLHELVRPFVLMPGDSGYKGKGGSDVPVQLRQKAMAKVISMSKKEPDFITRARERLTGLLSDGG